MKYHLKMLKILHPEYDTVDVLHVFREVHTGIEWTLLRMSKTHVKPAPPAQCKDKIPTVESKQRRTIRKPRGPLAALWANQYYGS